MFILRGYPCKVALADLVQLRHTNSNQDQLSRVRNLNAELDAALSKAAPTLASKLYLDFNGKFLSKISADLADALRAESIVYDKTDLDFLGYLILCAEKANVLLAHYTCETIFKKSSAQKKDKYLHGIVSSDGDAQIIPTITIQTVDLSGDPVSLVIYLGEFSAQRTKGEWEEFLLLGVKAFTENTKNLDLSYGGSQEIYLVNDNVNPTSNQPDFWGSNYLALKKWILGE